MFQSTRPLGGATPIGTRIHEYRLVSIHAPPGGRDLPITRAGYKDQVFQSTRPLGGATERPGSRHVAEKVSIHAPPGGRDRAE